MDNQTIKARLAALAEPQYASFIGGLTPGACGILGVRMPHLRALAKEIAKGDWRAYLENATDDAYEETMLQGLVIAYAKTEFHETLRLCAGFVPKIDNWAICDSFCATLKQVEKHPDAAWDFLLPYVRDDRPFYIRFGVVMLLFHFIDEAHIEGILAELEAIRSGEYYVRMAVAWAVADCYIKYPEATLATLQENRLDDFTHNKAIQKITESYRVPPEDKAMLRTLKRKRAR